MDNKSFVKKLKKLNACEDAVNWCVQHGGTSAELWRDCERGDWMAWYAAKVGVDKRALVGALADCAALSLKYYEAQYPDDKRVRECIATCRRYAKGKATEEDVRNAANSAADAAHAAAYAAYAAAYAKTLKKCAAIFRKHFPELPL